jgi:glyoxylase-like metal-dependent hydrolase (beta-lactamase superfamily II)
MTVKEFSMLERLSDRVRYAPGGVNIGVVEGSDDTVILIDSGLNDTAVRKVLRAIAEEGRTVSTVVTTHGHADHFGGNAFVVKRTGARVYAPSWDEAVLRYPLFQPLCLFAGADPPATLRGGFLLAQPSPVDVIYDEGKLSVDGVTLVAVSLKGHSANQMGILVDGVFFCADVILPERVLERYKMPYLYSVRDHVESLQRASNTPHLIAVPGHGPPLEHVSQLVELNATLVERVADIVLDACREPATPEDILAFVLEALGADPADPAAYYLLHPTVFAYLSYLGDRRLLGNEISRGRSLWMRT